MPPRSGPEGHSADIVHLPRKIAEEAFRAAGYMTMREAFEDSPVEQQILAYIESLGN